MTTADLHLASMSEAAQSAKPGMKALVYHGAGKRAWEEQAAPRDPGAGRRHRARYDLDDLRNRSSHFEGRSACGNRRAAFWATRGLESSSKSEPASRNFTWETR